MASSKKQAITPNPAEFRNALLSAVQTADKPLKPAPFLKAHKIRAIEVPSLLAEELTTGRIFNWGTEKSPAYWHRDARTEARNRLIEAARNMPSKPGLSSAAAKGAPKLPPGVLKSLVADLFREGRLRLLPSKIVLDVEHPELYLEAEISKLLKAFNRERPALRIRALLAPEQAALQPTTTEAVENIASQMFEAINRIAFSPGATVTFYRLRQQPELAEVPKQTFDHAALLLEKERKALLSLHDHAPALAEEERERFVTDGLGTYYVSICAR